MMETRATTGAQSLHARNAGLSLVNGAIDGRGLRSHVEVTTKG